jgi:hypothetical protein
MEGVIFMSKQDRHGARTTADLERKYNFGKSFAEVMGLANDARRSAEAAEKRFEGLDHEMIFRLLTNNGALQGLYRGDDGELYINASYIKTGTLLAALLKTGVIKSADGSVELDLTNNRIRVYSADKSYWFQISAGSIEHYRNQNGKTVRQLRIYPGDSDTPVTRIVNENGDIVLSGSSHTNLGTLACSSRLDGGEVNIFATNSSGKSGTVDITGTTVKINGKIVAWKDNGDGTFTMTGT